MLDHCPVPNPAIAARQFGPEIVTIDPQANMVRMFNATGSRIWQLMDGSRSVEGIARVLADEYTVSITHVTESVRIFLDQLQKEGLIHRLPLSNQE